MTCGTSGVGVGVALPVGVGVGLPLVVGLGVGVDVGEGEGVGVGVPEIILTVQVSLAVRPLRTTMLSLCPAWPTPNFVINEAPMPVPGVP